MGTNKNALLLYEINTPVWLTRLSEQHHREITLANVPDEALQKLAGYGTNIVWLMGIWERSPRSVAIGEADEGLQAAMRDVLPDFRSEDFIGSAYSVRDYKVNHKFGGEAALQLFREQLTKLGMGLMLDFVPNHTAPDHPWATEHPDYYIHGSWEDLERDPSSYIECNGTVFANGRDPQFPAWGDVIQVNAFSAGYRQAAVDTLRYIATLCDAVRCDMAMLLMDDIFEANWGQQVGPAPERDFWEGVITRVHETNPQLAFLAEAYWDTEQDLLAQGFDYCYDKTLYDMLEGASTGAITTYIRGTSSYQHRLSQFIENHDEPRAASTFSVPKEKAAAAIVAMLPGPWLLHDGQVEGYKVKLPVHIGRGPQETVDSELYDFYVKLLSVRTSWKLQQLDWRTLEHDNQHVIAFEWAGEAGKHVLLVNYGNFSTHAVLPPSDKAYTDELSGETLEVSPEGVHLDAWQVRLLS